MGDTIRVNTELLERCAGELKIAAQGFGDAASILAGLNTGEEWWTKMGRFTALPLKDEATSADMGADAGSAVRAMTNVMRRYDGRMTRLGGSVARAAESFRNVEGTLTAKAGAQRAGTDAGIIGKAVIAGAVAAAVDAATATEFNDKPLSREEQLREEEDWLVDSIERMIANDYIKKWYDGLDFSGIVTAGNIFNVIQLKAEDMIMSDGAVSVNMLDGILDHYSTWNGDVLDNVTKLVDAGVNQADRTSDMLKGITSLMSKGEAIAESGDVFDRFFVISQSVKGAEGVTNVINRYNKMMNMDPELAKTLARGLRESGDPRAVATAEALEHVGDPAACLKYCLDYESSKLQAGLAGDTARGIIGDAAYKSPLAPIQASKDASTFVVENLFNTSKTAEAAAYAESVSQMRQQTRQALTNAIDEYHRNPSSATADKVAALYKAYNAQGAEQINAVKEVTKATDTSIAGIVSGNMKKHQDGVRRMEQMANAEANNNNIIAENERRIRELRTR